jgi:hypothetical protein
MDRFFSSRDDPGDGLDFGGGGLNDGLPLLNKGALVDLFDGDRLFLG